MAQVSDFFALCKEIAGIFGNESTWIISGSCSVELVVLSSPRPMGWPHAHAVSPKLQARCVSCRQPELLLFQSVL